MLIIGITGTIGAGKGTVVDYIVKKHSFQHLSARDFLTKEVNRRNLVLNRDSLTSVANDLRAEFGSAYIIEQLFNIACASNKNSIIESIRTVGEIDCLKTKINSDTKFVLLSVDADPKLRHERILIRNSATDNIDFGTFLANEEREFTNDDPNKQNLSACMHLADIKLSNNGSIEDLHKEIDNALDILRQKEGIDTRPNWDNYFMQLCKTVAQRATCNRGKSGCVIVKDKQILVTGYVGSPSNLPHCDQAGHLFKQMIHDNNEITTHCVRTVHAEQNAICQAAKRGIALDGSTLYCTMTPCRVCTMLIINCGIKNIVCEYKYHNGSESEAMLKDAGINLKYFNEEILQYNK